MTLDKKVIEVDGIEFTEDRLDFEKNGDRKLEKGPLTDFIKNKTGYTTSRVNQILIAVSLFIFAVAAVFLLIGYYKRYSVPKIENEYNNPNEPLRTLGE